MRTWLVDEENMKTAVDYADAQSLAVQFVRDLASISLEYVSVPENLTEKEILMAQADRLETAIKTARILVAALGDE